MRSSTLARRALAKSEHFFQVPVCLLVVPAALGEPETASCQLVSGRRVGDKVLLPLPPPQRTVLQLLRSLRIKLPPGRCRWWSEKADRIKVIRPANSRFKTLLDCRTYFLIRRQLTYTPKEAQRSHRLNKRLDGAFLGQQQFAGALHLGIFMFLTTFHRTRDAVGLTHGQALPLMVFRPAGNAKTAFSGALNSNLRRQRFAIRTNGDAVNWLLSKYATHATMDHAYQDIITMKQQVNEAPTACDHRVETQCDLLNGLLVIQDGKVVFITGLWDLVQAHVRVLNDRFPDRTLSETVATAQMYWDGTNKLRLQLKMTHP